MTVAWMGSSVGLGWVLGLLALVVATGILRIVVAAVQGRLTPGRASWAVFAFAQAIPVGLWARSSLLDQRIADGLVPISLVLACLGHLLLQSPVGKGDPAN